MAAITGAVIAGAGLAASVSGNRRASKDARRATEAQTASGQAAIESQEAAQAESTRLRQPFTQFGVSNLAPLQQAIAPLTQEQEFAQLQSSPLFQAAQAEGRRNALGALSVGGRVGSGDESAILQNQLLLNAAPLLQNQQAQRQQNINNLFGAVNTGQASAVGQAVSGTNTAQNVGNLQTGIGNVAGAGIAAQSNLRTQGTQDLISQLPGAVRGIGGLFTPPPPVQPPAGGVQNPNIFGGFA